MFVCGLSQDDVDVLNTSNLNGHTLRQLHFDHDTLQLSSEEGARTFSSQYQNVCSSTVARLPSFFVGFFCLPNLKRSTSLGRLLGQRARDKQYRFSKRMPRQ
jgi:hypothetical protein